MKPVRYPKALVTKVDKRARRIVEKMAETEKLSLGEATRALLDADIEARGIKC